LRNLGVNTVAKIRRCRTSKGKVQGKILGSAERIRKGGRGGRRAFGEGKAPYFRTGRQKRVPTGGHKRAKTGDRKKSGSESWKGYWEEGVRSEVSKGKTPQWDHSKSVAKVTRGEDPGYILKNGICSGSLC